MNIFLVSCDLNNPERDYTNFYKEMYQYTSRLYFDSTWLIKTNKKIDEVEEHFVSMVDSTEKIIICKVEKSISGSLSTLQWDWIEENL